MNDQPPLALCGWPGLAGLWLRGRWPSLLVAVGFAFLLNLALVSTFVWPALLGDSVKALLWPVLAVTWALGAWNSWRLLGGLHKNGPETAANDASDTDHTLFIQAQTEYLKGDYQRSESLLAQRLQENNRDIESRLLLASVFERSGRLEKAERQLDMLGRLDESKPWRFEIERLRQRIHEGLEDRDEVNSLGQEDKHQELPSSNEDDTEQRDVTNREPTNHEGQSESGKVKLGQAHRSKNSVLSFESERLVLEDQEDHTDPLHKLDDHFGDDRQVA